MSETPKHILLISYSFPPNADVGARRWAKISKYLVRKNMIVHVLTVGDKDETEPLYLKGDERIRVYYVKENYPVRFYLPPVNLIDKIRRKFLLFFLKFIIKGTLYDRGAFLEKKIIARSIGLIDEFDIKNIIATGAPFSLLRYAVRIKKQRNVMVICDLRDPWMDGEVYGYANLSPGRKKVEYAYENEVMVNADIVLTPAKKMTQRLMDEYGQKTEAGKFQVLLHPFDREEFGNSLEDIRVSDDINIVTGGTIDLIRIEPVAGALFNALHKMKEDHPALYAKVSVDFFGTSKILPSMLAQIAIKNVHFRAKTTPEIFFGHLRSANFLLILLPDYVKDYFITKFGEYVALNIPILLVSYQGEVSEFLQKNRLGTFIDVESDTVNEDFYEAMRLMSEGKYAYNNHFDAGIFSCEHAVQQLESYFI